MVYTFLMDTLFTNPGVEEYDGANGERLLNYTEAYQNSHRRIEDNEDHISKKLRKLKERNINTGLEYQIQRGPKSRM